MARLGLGDAWTCLLANDFDPLKTRAYAANFGADHLKAGDVFALSAADLPGVRVVLDGRKIVDAAAFAAAGVTVERIGRPSTTPPAR